MPKEILIAKNITREGPGLIEEVLQEESLPYRIVDLSQGQAITAQDSFDILVVMGGPDSANDKTQKMQAEIQSVEEAIKSGKPFLGVCLGLQVMVKAMGGEVVKGSAPEIGFRSQSGGFNAINLTIDGKNDPLFTGLGSTFRVFHLHGETVNLTPQMKLLGTGRDVDNQIVRVGTKAYGIQCHFELTGEMLETWLAQDDDLKAQDQGQIRSDFAANRAKYTQVGKKLVRNFLEIAQAA